MKMHAANNKGITILGATILRISGKDDQGRTCRNETNDFMLLTTLISYLLAEKLVLLLE